MAGGTRSIVNIVVVQSCSVQTRFTKTFPSQSHYCPFNSIGLCEHLMPMCCDNTRINDSRRAVTSLNFE